MTSVLLCLLPVLNPFGYAQATRPDKPPFTVTISADHPTPRVGEPLMIHIVLESVSQDPITVVQERHVGDRGDFNYRITVVYVDGSPVRDSYEGMLIKNGTRVMQHSVIDKQLQLGDKIEEDANLNNVVEITAPGYYWVQVERSDPIFGGLHIKSNKLLMRVKP